MLDFAVANTWFYKRPSLTAANRLARAKG